MTWTQKRTACERLGQFALTLGMFLLALAAGSVVCAQAAKDKTAPVEPAKGDKARLPDDWPRMLSAAEYRKLMDELKKLKPEKTPVSECRLTGKLEDAFVLVRAEVKFQVRELPAVVPLGLQPAAVVEGGELDPQNFDLCVGDNGYYLKAYRAGPGKLTLNLKVPVGPRRTARGGSDERGFNLALPGAVITSLTLDLPQNIKEIRCKTQRTEGRGPTEDAGLVMKPKPAGHWEMPSLGAVKNLEVVWKEPVAAPGTKPLQSAVGDIVVRLADESSVDVQAKLKLEVRPGHEVQDWQLLLPTQAKLTPADVTFADPNAAPALSVEVLPPTGGNPHWIVHFDKAHAEPFTVHVKMAHLPRTNLMKIGPFLVENAYQDGTIVVQAPPGSLRGQKLVFHETGVRREDLPKGAAGTDAVALFRYPLPNPPPAGKELLGIDFHTERGMVATHVDHQLKLRTGDGGLQIDVVSNIKITPLSAAGVDFLDVQMPRIEPSLLGLLLTDASAGIPAGVPWSGLLDYWPREPAQALTVFGLKPDEGAGGVVPELQRLDGQGKVRIKFGRVLANKEFVLTLRGRYVVPSALTTPSSEALTRALASQRFRIELPRPQGILDYGTDVTVRGNEQIELLSGPAGFLEPTSEIKLKWDVVTTDLEVAWRPYRPQFPAQNVTDITLRDRHAQVRQQLTFTAPAIARSSQVRLRVPKSVPLDTLKVLSGGKRKSSDPEGGFVWVELAPGPTDREQQVLTLEFHQFVDGESWKVPFIWPNDAVQLEARVRVWCEPGAAPQLIDPDNRWQDLPTELVPGRPLPILVVQEAGRNPELTLRPPARREAAATGPGRLPLLLCERALIKVDVDEAGTQFYRARYVIGALHANALDIEFPAPVSTCVQSIEVGAVPITPIYEEKEWKVAHLVLEPSLFRKDAVLDIKYKLPASFPGGKPSWQTVLQAPVFMGDVALEQVRWQVDLPPSWVALVAADRIQCDWRWSFQSWLLTPEPTLSAGDLERWLTHRPEADSGETASLVFGRSSHGPIVIIHLGRQMWLIVCSGTVLVFGLLLFLMPLPRTLFWTMVLCLTAGLVSAGILWPTWVPPVVFGVQPGLVVLILVLGCQWLLQEHYRRQLVFMPGFTRVKSDSSLLKARPREPSTIAAPPQH